MAKNVASSNNQAAKPTPPPTALPNINAAGDFYYSTGLSYAGYWLNNNQFNFVNNPNQTIESTFKKVYINGLDVYLTGRTYNGTANVATIYKNGVLFSQYPSTSSNPAVIVSDMIVSGSNVFAVGNDGNRAVIWQNGIQSILKSTISRATGIVSYNNQNYVIGDDLLFFDLANVTATTKSYLWINGQETVLSNFGLRYTTEIKIYNNILYICGGTIVNGIKVPMYLTKNLITNGNFVATTISSTVNSSAKAIEIVNSDVYLCGGANGKPVFWKNGIMTTLSTLNGESNDISSFGTDIYIGGTAQNGNSKAAMWRNGVYTSYNGTLPGSIINSIALQ